MEGSPQGTRSTEPQYTTGPPSHCGSAPPPSQGAGSPGFHTWSDAWIQRKQSSQIWKGILKSRCFIQSLNRSITTPILLEGGVCYSDNRWLIFELNSQSNCTPHSRASEARFLSSGIVHELGQTTMFVSTLQRQVCVQTPAFECTHWADS